MILYMATWLSEKAQREVLNHCEKRERGFSLIGLLKAQKRVLLNMLRV